MTEAHATAGHSERVRNLAAYMQMRGLAQFSTRARHGEKRVRVNGQEYGSAAEAHRLTGIAEKSIREACNGIRRKGWTFTAEFV